MLIFGNIGAGEILIIALVVLLFFGGKKIPELMRGLGKGMRSFKDGMNEIQKDLSLDDAPTKNKPSTEERKVADTNSDVANQSKEEANA